MNRRRLALVLGLVLAALLGLWLGPRLHLGAHAGSLPDLLELAPADSTTIAYVDLVALRATPWMERLASTLPPVNLDRDYADFVSATGFAFERDLDRLMVAGRPGPAEQTLVLADGRFDRQKIGQYALRSGKLENHNGRAVYVVPSATPGKNISLAFLEGNRIALSDGGDLPSLLASMLAPAPSALDPALRERLSRVAGAPLFAVTKIRPPAAGRSAAANPLLPFQNLRWASLAAKPDGGQIVISAEGECDDAAQAQSLASGLEFLRSLLRGGLADPKARGNMTADGAAALSRLLQSVSISNSAGRVRLLLTATPDMLSALASLAPAPTPTPKPTLRPTPDATPRSR